MGFKEIALPLAAKGVPCTPVLPNSKKAFMPDWPTSATTDRDKLLAWDAQYPNHNGAAVATGAPDGVWFFEVDSPEVRPRVEAETGQKIPETFCVRSRPGRGHYYWKQTPASLAMGNIGQSYVKGGDWSARVSNQYVVAPGSIHPSSKQPYTAVNDNPIAPCPDWLVAWCISQKTSGTHASSEQKVASIERNVQGLIPHGQIHPYLVTEAGRLRNQGLSVELIEIALIELAHKNCVAPIDEDKVKQVARSFEKYEAGQPTDLLMTPKPEPPGPVAIVKRAHPEFPLWVMNGTSLFRNFVEPVCKKNPARIPYFMFMPAVTLLLNYLGTKVQIGVKKSMALRHIPLSLFMVLVGQRGQTKKSSCIDEAVNYFHFMGLTSHANTDVKTAEGRSLIWTPGSTEGFGLGMQRSQCKNGIILYDELSVLERKAAIESSTLPQTLLTGYESKKLSNSTKKTKEIFDLEPGAYVMSFLAGCTTEKFIETWAILSRGADGLDDRFTVILEPEKLSKSTPYQAVDVFSKAHETRALIDKAVNKGMFQIIDDGPLVLAISECGFTDREEIRAEKYALAFAVDMGLDEIDEDCVERGIAVVQYERAVKRKLHAVDTANKSAALQLKMRKKLEDLVMESPDHKTTKRLLERKLNSYRWGTHLGAQVYSGLVNAGIIGQDKDGNVWVIEPLPSMDEDNE